MKTSLPVLLLSLLLMASCAPNPIPPPVWSFEKHAVNLHFQADTRLNVVSGTPHTLHISLYQLANPNAFNQLKEDQSGLEELLKGKIFDPSAVSASTYVIYPDSDVTYKIDRAEGAVYIAIVAGYELLDNNRMIRLYEIPVYGKTEGHFWDHTEKLVPAHLAIELKLGPDQIVHDEITALNKNRKEK